MVLALELSEQFGDMPEDQLIEYEHLQECVLERLGLELLDSQNDLPWIISDQMLEWNWQPLSYCDGMQEFYARPLKQSATQVLLWGSHFVLQPDQYFPGDISDIEKNLRQSNFAIPFLEVDEEGYLNRPSDPASDKSLIKAYLEAHLIKPDDSIMLA